MSELFGLTWKDVDFDANEISVVRSIVMLKRRLWVSSLCRR